jgi:hypothetical protein
MSSIPLTAKLKTGFDRKQIELQKSIKYSIVKSFITQINLQGTRMLKEVKSIIGFGKKYL